MKATDDEFDVKVRAAIVAAMRYVSDTGSPEWTGAVQSALKSIHKAIESRSTPTGETEPRRHYCAEHSIEDYEPIPCDDPECERAGRFRTPLTIGCEKCGGTDIFTRYTTVGGMLGADRDRLGQSYNNRKEEATEECLYRGCRNCQWWWTDPVEPVGASASPQEGEAVNFLENIYDCWGHGFASLNDFMRTHSRRIEELITEGASAGSGEPEFTQADVAIIRALARSHHIMGDEFARGAPGTGDLPEKHHEMGETFVSLADRIEKALATPGPRAEDG